MSRLKILKTNKPYIVEGVLVQHVGWFRRFMGWTDSPDPETYRFGKNQYGDNVWFDGVPPSGRYICYFPDDTWFRIEW